MWRHTMFKTLRQHHSQESGQIVIMLALAMMVLLGMVGLAIDGGMLYWNQRRAQNGADAAAVAGTQALVNETLVDDYICGTVPETVILDSVYQYAANNEVPDAEAGENIEAYYLTEDAAGNRVDLLDGSGNSWKVGTTGVIPCEDIVGLRVRASFPQDTFLAGVIGVMETNVTVEAYAVFDHRSWCTDFALFGINPGGGDTISINPSEGWVMNGGIHSNSGILLGGTIVHLERERPIEYDVDDTPKFNPNKIDGGPDPDDDEMKGFTAVPNYPLADDFYYRFEDFAPPEVSPPSGGFIWNEVDAAHRFYSPVSLGTSDERFFKNADGSLKDGLYVVNGSVKLNNLKNLGDRPWRVTIVATGNVEISGSINQLPYIRGLFIYTLSDNMSNGAVNLSGSDNQWAGMIVAPNGEASVSGSKVNNLSGMIVAQDISISGSTIKLNHRPEYCPPDPPRVMLTK